MAFCKGCYENFSSVGYTSHLLQTTKPSCIAQRDLEFANPFGSPDFDSDRDPDVDEAESDLDEDDDSIPRYFQGDYYGSDYSPDDFAWPQDDADDAMNVDEPGPRMQETENQVNTVGPEDPEASPPGNVDHHDDGRDDDAVADILDEALRPHWEPAPRTSQMNTTSTSEDDAISSTLNAPPQANPDVVEPLVDHPSSSNAAAPSSSASPHLARAEAAMRQKIEKVLFPSTTAGRPISSAAPSGTSAASAAAARAGYAAYEKEIKAAVTTLQRAGSKHVKPQSTRDGDGDAETVNPYAPFPSRLDWEVARWSKLRGPTSTAVSELLGIDGVAKTLGLSCASVKDINDMVDALPSPRPQFLTDEVLIGGEAYEVYFRDVLQCVRSLYGDPEFARHLKFLPERHYADPDHTMRLYHDMYTGKWWWAVQNALEKDAPGATVIPIIISSDKTQLTLFRNKTAYPIYLTIGNLPKDIRSKPSQRGQILLGYLPTTKLEQITNKSARRRMLANLFHACVRRILEPLRKAGETGVPMFSGDGVQRRVHPILAAFVGDYPEQVLVTGVLTGDCPVCDCPRDELGDLDASFEVRDLDEALRMFSLADTSPAQFLQACAGARIKPLYHPFWQDLPYADIFLSITPDILHQLYQGVVKHLVSWIQTVYDKDEIDARCRRLPPNHSLRHFSKGITKLSRLSGQEHSDICRILLGLIIDMPLPDGMSPARLVRAVRAMLDFVYIAQYPLQSTDTLDALDAALREFHANKEIFVELGVRPDFNFPKLHSLRHYRPSIEYLGSLDNFNTEYTERLHIDFAKDAYRATNKKDEFPQMTLWLQRKEKVLRHAAYIKWHKDGRPPLDRMNPLYKKTDTDDQLFMTRHPSVKSVSFDDLGRDYGAVNFRRELARFIVGYHNPGISAASIRSKADKYHLPFTSVPVYHKAKLWDSDFPRYRHASDDQDVVHATPARTRQDKRKTVIPGRFDTALINTGLGGASGVTGYRIGQVRAIFTLPQRECARVLPGPDAPLYLAYVEWFTPFGRPEANHGMYKLSRATVSSSRGGTARFATVIPLRNLRRSIHLFPQFGHTVPRDWSTDNVLDKSSKFYVNVFTDRHVYGTVY